MLCAFFTTTPPASFEDLNSPQISKIYSHSKNDNWILDLAELIHHMIEDFFFCCLLLLLTDFLLPLPSLSLLQLVLLWYQGQLHGPQMSINFAGERYFSNSKKELWLQYTVLQLPLIKIWLLLMAGLCVCVSKYGHPSGYSQNKNQRLRTVPVSAENLVQST